jgi:Voltage-dependent L-type calcium channel, IQ-associated
VSTSRHRYQPSVTKNFPVSSGKIHYTEMYDMLKNMDPPLGFGNKCPNRLAYKKLIRMNMPMDADGKVNFTTTLFALIRENLSIKMRTGKKLHALLGTNFDVLTSANNFKVSDLDLH